MTVQLSVATRTSKAAQLQAKQPVGLALVAAATSRVAMVHLALSN